MIRRRQLLAAAATLPLTRPAIAQPAIVLRFVPNVDLPVLDPIANTAAQVRNHAFLIYDTLFGLDENFEPQPQMLSAAGADTDGLVWTLQLRDGLRFHDGTPVDRAPAGTGLLERLGIDGGSLGHDRGRPSWTRWRARSRSRSSTAGEPGVLGLAVDAYLGDR